MTQPASPRCDLIRALRELGFEQPSHAPVLYRREPEPITKYIAEAKSDWLTFHTLGDVDQDALAGPSRSGLWKLAQQFDGGPWSWQFQIPRSILVDNLDLLDDEQHRSPLAAVVDWGLESARGGTTPGWQPPTKADLANLSGAQTLTVQNGPLIRQGTWICQPQQLAARIPLVPSWSADLAESRRVWLRRTLLDAQCRWKMVRLRLGSGTPSDPAVSAEVDFTGAPAGLWDALLRAGLDALRFVAGWLLWPVSVLCDPGVLCNAWEIDPERLFAAERRAVYANVT